MNVYLVGSGMVTPAGASAQEAFAALARGIPCLKWEDALGPVGRITGEEPPGTRHQDRAVRFGVVAAKQAFAAAGKPDARDMAVVMGSSRGATATLERDHDRFLETGKAAPHTSPMTTMGAFSADVAQALKAGGPVFSISSACSTGLNAVGAAYALLKSGMAGVALAGGAEASLTPFTLAQLRATGVLARQPSALYPARPFHPERSGLVPGEGAACIMLSTKPMSGCVRLLGVGAAAEAATATGISADGEALIVACRRALAMAGMGPGDIDLIVAHGAGTVRGDAAELAAYERMFEGRPPPITAHKWLTGHMLGAAGVFSLALAKEHLVTGDVPGLPYHEDGLAVGRAAALGPAGARRALVTALGFGGGASAVVIERG